MFTEVDSLAGALPAAPGSNLVVVFVDTLRADHLPNYGYPRDTLPTIGGEPWVTVAGMRAVSSWTGPTTASALTGLQPWRHGVTSLQEGELNAANTSPTLFADLRAAGWATALFTANGIVGIDGGMSADFDTWYLAGKDDGLRDASNHLPRVLTWVDSLPADQPFAVWVQPMDMHSPYSPEAQDLGTWSDTDLLFSIDAEHAEQEAAIADAWKADPETTRTQVRDVYDEQLLGLDRSMRALLDGLEARGVLDDTVVVFAADHGESLDDAGDGTFGHFGSLRYELLDVPLMVRVPGAEAAQVRCGGESVDLAPTLLTLLGVAPRGGLDGQSLQGGCRTLTRAAFWQADDWLQVISVADMTVQATRTCGSGEQSWYDLSPASHGTAWLDVPGDAEEWTSILDDQARDIQAYRPQDACLAPW